MSLLEQQTFLAKLYTDENFRENFIAKPYIVGLEHKLDRSEISELEEILPDEIMAFADSLFYKRLREVEKHLPLAKQGLDEEFELHFREFAKTFNPLSVKKHLEDALEFAKYLESKNLYPTWLKDLVKLERAKLEFGGFGKRFILKKLDYDLRNIYQIKVNKNKDFGKRYTLAIWLKFGKIHRQYIF